MARREEATERDAHDLAESLRRLDGRGYKAYKAVEGRWAFPSFTLVVDHVQGDPFADPSRVRVLVPGSVAGLPPDCCRAGSRAVGLASLLATTFSRLATEHSRPRGSGKSGRIEMVAPGQQVLRQSAVLVAPDGSVEARFRVGLPARGRRVLAGEAIAMLSEDVPSVVQGSLRAEAYGPAEPRRASDTNEDADALRSSLAGLDLVGFVADGALLPRASGVDDRPLAEGAIAFQSPDSLRVSVELPHCGTVTGMGIPRGVTLIVGGGYHGKSTLLRALESGVYNHRPEDGRERVATDPHAVKIRAEDGRAVTAVDVSPFIGNLPLGTDTTAFSTPNASGSTSQAAAIVEAIEAGGRVLLMDEDTSATNFMIRDRRMQALVPKADEPITPFVDRVRDLSERFAVSAILVIGGSGDYLDVADTVISMHEYRPRDVGEEARGVVRDHPTGRRSEGSGGALRPAHRVPLPPGIEPRRGHRAVHVRVQDRNRLEVGTTLLDLTGVDQVVSVAQASALGRALVMAGQRFIDGTRTLPEILDLVMATVHAEGLDALDARKVGSLAEFRRHELAAAFNRARGLRLVGAP